MMNLLICVNQWKYNEMIKEEKTFRIFTLYPKHCCYTYLDSSHNENPFFFYVLLLS